MSNPFVAAGLMPNVRTYVAGGGGIVLMSLGVVRDVTYRGAVHEALAVAVHSVMNNKKAIPSLYFNIRSPFFHHIALIAFL